MFVPLLILDKGAACGLHGRQPFQVRARPGSLKRSSVSLHLSFAQDILLSAHVPEHITGSFIE